MEADKMGLATKEHVKAMGELGDHFRAFGRNGVWGTCGGCPRDSSRNAYPEFCALSFRSDHRLSLAALTEQYLRSTGG